MIIDKIANHGLYTGLGGRIALALAYIKETDFSAAAPGKYKIDGDVIFAIVQEYSTKDRSECKLEGHFKYTDIQYIVSGAELMGVATLTSQKPVYKNPDEDYALFESDPAFFRIDPGMFAIFFPDDLHMPCVQLERSARVKKVVVKVRLR
ncbi:MAG: YhcH/YjgK/YiaL family protein [Candidatus Omnitrophota bacterium]|nr:DUF386 domain-containing protein [Candidatus Omnitrophota bacterium]MBU2528713.1 YhcH/YjgK/YiaL family protein [bacterium]MBU3929396.1 YhcH/YjgK/YiaL family protein [bacterium]MBU4123772.1 YhcH/YjgK/YiaL family protein [bacterium]